MPISPTLEDVSMIMFSYLRTVKNPIYKTALIIKTQIETNKILYKPYYQSSWIPDPHKTKILSLARIVFDQFVKEGIIKYSPQRPIEIFLNKEFPTLKNGY